MIRRETSFILLLASACSQAHYPPKPDLPSSVTPSWTLKGLEKAGECWKGNYASGPAGSAEVLVCGYSSPAGAFDALQRTAAVANTVKFQEGSRLALVKWNGASREEVKALVLGIQRAIK